MQENICNEFIPSLFFSGAVAVPVMLLDSYAEMGLDAEEMLFIIHAIQTGAWQGDIDLELIRKKMGLELAALDRLIRGLEKKLVLKPGKGSGATGLDFSGLPEQLFEIWGIRRYFNMKRAEREKEGEPAAPATGLVRGEESFIELYEKELGRGLTMMECEIVRDWLIKGHSEELLRHALRKGVEGEIRVPRYLDSILREWEKKGLRTVLEVEAEDEKYRRSKKNARKPRSRHQPPDKTKYDNLYLN
ncbi:MAG: DnaD domain protein [Gracilibacteraceae bacterium]|jgi:DNA replication protein|nr:DnaD domain protein [Gracilibacteraceae bacterium]